MSTGRGGCYLKGLFYKFQHMEKSGENFTGLASVPA